MLKSWLCNVDSKVGINRWVINYAPLLEAVFRKPHNRPVGIYIKLKGKWVYSYRALYKEGNTVDFMLSEHRD
jgi:putative transposase